MSHITKSCLHCQVEFEASLKEHNRGNAKYCTPKCSQQARKLNYVKPAPNFTCATCDTPIYRKPYQQKNTKHGYFFCSRTCKEHAQTIGHEKSIPDIMPNHYGDGGYTASKHYRKKALSEKEEIKCERCGYDRYPQILQVHHKDRNRKNSDISNLEILCSTCHDEDHFLAGDGRFTNRK